MLTGFGNHFSSEALPGALPVGRNSPQKVPFGLYAEQFSGTAFTAPRSDNRRSWLYRIRPAASHPAYVPYTGPSPIDSAPIVAVPTPTRLRWNPLPRPDHDVDFVDGIVTYGGNGDVAAMFGIAVHLYAATASMRNRVFQCSDGELLVVPQYGTLDITTEMGRMAVPPGSIAVLPRGIRFRVAVPNEGARGYICENYGTSFALPDLGPIGANGLANTRDFEAPDAWFEDVETPTEIVQKFGGALWTTTIGHSPLDVVAWHGNLTPYRYDLARFNAINSVSFDHPDPSIFTVLTSPSTLPGTADCDFVIFPPRWLVAEDTFRPPWFHRNVMSEFMGLIEGAYDAKQGGFSPGGASLHNQMNGHGPDRASYAKAVEAELKPVYLSGTMAFMFESRLVIRPTASAMDAPHRQTDYDSVWDAFPKAVVTGTRA